MYKKYLYAIQNKFRANMIELTVDGAKLLRRSVIIMPVVLYDRSDDAEVA